MRLVALLMAFVMSPGSLELVQDGVHLAVEGHALHDAVAPSDDGSGDGHAPDTEHRCSGAFHLCPCHAPPTFVPAQIAIGLEDAVVLSDHGSSLPAATELPLGGFSSSLFRPPIG